MPIKHPALQLVSMRLCSKASLRQPSRPALVRKV